MNIHTQRIAFGGTSLSIETGKLAKQADGAVVVRQGDTMVLVTACHAASPREGIDFLPLTVDYRENTYASGRIPGGFFKREGKPPEKEVLTSRLIDRPIRPLFPAGWRYETQVVALVISADTENDSDVLALTGAGAALALSEIPFAKPIAGVRIGLVDGAFVVNPTYDQRRKSRLDLIVAGTADAIVMVEAGAREVSENVVLDAFEAAHAEIRRICDLQRQLREDAGKEKLAVTYTPKFSDELLQEVLGQHGDALKQAMLTTGKHTRYAAIKAARTQILATVPADDAEKLAATTAAIGEAEVHIFRNLMLDENKRVDGRRFDEIRPITIPNKVHWSFFL